MNRWGLHVIRLADLTLIVFPEPITEGIGIVTLLGTSLLTKRYNDEVLEYFEQVLREHLTRTCHLEYVMSSYKSREEIVKHNTLNLNTGNLSRSLMLENSLKSRETERLIYRHIHTPLPVRNNISGILKPKIKVSFNRYSTRNDESIPSKKVIHHKLDIEQLSRRYQIKEHPNPVKRRTEKSKSLIYYRLPESPGFTTSTGLKRKTYLA